MPIMRKLRDEEATALDNKGMSARDITMAQYDQLMADFEPNDYGQADLSEGERKLTVRNRLKAAAERRGFTLEFIRTPGAALRFKVVGDGAEASGYAEEGQEELAVAA
jgi:hypothetical protein